MKGWTLPRSASGRSALVAPPPWHYSGDIIAVDYRADPERVVGFFPAGIDPEPDGGASIVFADWSSASDNDPRVAADPARGQHHETYVVVYGRRSGQRVGRIAAIWVDNDLSLVRGLIQGFPKKLGQIAMTRAVAVGKGGPRRQPGDRFAAHVSALGVRLASVDVTIEGEDTSGRYPRSVATPLIHTRWWPRIDGDGAAIDELTRGTIAGFEIGTVHTGAAHLSFGDSDFEELDLVAPVQVDRGWVFSMGFSVLGGTVEDGAAP